MLCGSFCAESFPSFLRIVFAHFPLELLAEHVSVHPCAPMCTRGGGGGWPNAEVVRVPAVTGHGFSHQPSPCRAYSYL